MIDGRYSRNIGAVSEAEQERLGRARVFVAGCGGIGGYLIEHLARAGAGYMLCADGGRFEASNLNRQILCDTRTLGQAKARAAEKRAALINPGVQVRGVDVRLDGANLPDLIRGCDLAIDALDNAPARRALADACKDQGVPAVHAAVRGWLVQAAFVPPGGGLYDMLYPDGAQSGSTGVLSFAPGMAAALQAAIAVRYLCGHGCDSDLHIYDLRDMSCSRVKI